MSNGQAAPHSAATAHGPATGTVARLFTAVRALPVRLWQEWSQLTLFSGLLVLSIPAMLAFILYTAFGKTYLWAFSVTAQAGVIELVTPPERETRWRINGAIVCSRNELAYGETRRVLAPAHGSPCGRRWHAYQADPGQDLVLLIRGSLDTLLEVREDRALYLALRPDRRTAPDSGTANASAMQPAVSVLPAGARLSFTNGASDLDLAGDGEPKVNFILPAPDAADGNARRDLVFPFSGDITVGRDVSWADSSLLYSGRIRVYTADESPDKRRLIDETDLVLGDQLRLDPVVRDGETVYPKGFARLVPGHGQFDVVAFGAADRVRIERFGDNGYNFRPGTLSLMIHDPLFLWVTGSYAGIIGAITGIAGACRKKPCK